MWQICNRNLKKKRIQVIINENQFKLELSAKLWNQSQIYRIPSWKKERQKLQKETKTNIMWISCHAVLVLLLLHSGRFLFPVSFLDHNFCFFFSFNVSKILFRNVSQCMYVCVRVNMCVHFTCSTNQIFACSCESIIFLQGKKSRKTTFLPPALKSSFHCKVFMATISVNKLNNVLLV